MAEPAEIDTQEATAKTRKRRFDQRDFDKIADFILEELARRKSDRRDLAKQWEDIDRQIAMTPKTDWKLDRSGKVRSELAWCPEHELPLQAETLEILVADTRRIVAPTVGPWFRAHCLTSDEYLRRVDLQSYVAGDENEIPSKITQDNADRLLEGCLLHVHRQQGDWWAQWDKFYGQGFSYGTSVGRVRKAKVTTFVEQLRGGGMVREEKYLPVFFARDIKDTYLDDTPCRVINEGLVLGPAVIHTKRQKLSDVVLAARDGANSPYDENGGWMAPKVAGLEADAQGFVDVTEWEGDLIVPRTTTENLYIPGALVTVIKGKDRARVVRMRFRKSPLTSYVVHPYHVERVDSPYGVGPLMKGRPLQSAASESFNRLMQSAILNTEPPVQYSPDDPFFAAEGGPRIMPRALWPATSDLKVHQIGDPAKLLQVYDIIRANYADMTGMNPSRFGQQTLSHTTAFAKDAELARGQVRTVDYANSIMEGPLPQVVDKQFSMLKECWPDEENVWIPEYGGWCRVPRDAIPDQAVFDIFGAAGPAEQRATIAEQLQAIQLAMSIEAIKQQTGQMDQKLDLTGIQKNILHKAKFTDVDTFFTGPPGGQAQPLAGGSGLPAAVAENPGLATVALQSLASAGQ